MFSVFLSLKNMSFFANTFSLSLSCRCISIPSPYLCHLHFQKKRFRSMYDRDVLQFEELLNENASWLNCSDHTTVAQQMADKDLIT